MPRSNVDANATMPMSLCDLILPLLAHPNGLWQALGDCTVAPIMGVVMVGKKERGRANDHRKPKIQRLGVQYILFKLID